MRNIPNKDDNGVCLYPCSFEIGEQATLDIPGDGINNNISCFVRAIIFTNSKVRFSLFLSNSETTLHNVDSAFVGKLDNPKFMDFEDDNYS